jgi:endonuclease III
LAFFRVKKNSANTNSSVCRRMPSSSFLHRGHTKVGRIIRVAGICNRDYGSDIPRTIDALMALPGVGLKMATLAMVKGWGDDVGIGVHVHRIGWAATKHPDKTEDRLQELFPKQWWASLNEAIVGFGQTICRATSPKCGQCPVADSRKAARGGNIEDEKKKEAKEERLR